MASTGRQSGVAHNVIKDRPLLFPLGNPPVRSFVWMSVHNLCEIPQVG
jgi:hypothetical protein